MNKILFKMKNTNKIQHMIKVAANKIQNNLRDNLNNKMNKIVNKLSKD